MTPAHPFDNAIHLDVVDGNVRRGRTHPEWANMVGPFGGILRPKRTAVDSQRRTTGHLTSNRLLQELACLKVPNDRNRAAMTERQTK